MKVSDMEEGKRYKCIWQDCLYSGWTKQGIQQRHPWMQNMNIWEEE